MDSNTLMQAVHNPAIDRVAEPLSKVVRSAYDAAGPTGQRAKNALHGVWLGHPLHPVFTDVPLGAWTTALALDKVRVVIPQNSVFVLNWMGARDAGKNSMRSGFPGLRCWMNRPLRWKEHNPPSLTFVVRMCS